MANIAEVKEEKYTEDPTLQMQKTPLRKCLRRKEIKQKILYSESRKS